MSQPDPVIRWGSPPYSSVSPVPPLGIFPETTKLNDGSLGDTATFESHLTTGNAPTTAAFEGFVMGFYDLGCKMQLVSVRATGRFDYTAAFQLGQAGGNIYIAYWDDVLNQWSDGTAATMPLQMTSYGGVVNYSPIPSYPYTRYVRVVVRGACTAVIGSWSVTPRISDFRVTVLPSPLPPDDPPSNLRGLGICEGNQITVLWDGCPCCDGYHIEVDGGDPIDVGDMAEYIHTPVSVPSEHHYRVRGYKILGGPGPWAETLALISCGDGDDGCHCEHTGAPAATDPGYLGSGGDCQTYSPAAPTASVYTGRTCPGGD